MSRFVIWDTKTTSRNPLGRLYVGLRTDSLREAKMLLVDMLRPHVGSEWEKRLEVREIS